MSPQKIFAVILLVACQPLVTFDAVAATMLQSNASARYGSGNTTYASDEEIGFNLLNDGTTGIQLVQNTNLSVAAVGSSNLSNNAIGAASAWIGASVIDHPPNGGTIWNLVANTDTRLFDDIEVTSATLPVGTPVQIEFSLHVSSTSNATHSVLPGNNNNKAFVRQFVSAFTMGPGGRFDVHAQDNSAFRDTSGAVPNQNNGLLDPNTPHLDYLFDAKVGDMLTFFVSIDSDVIGNLAPITVSFNPITLDNTAGQAFSSVGVAFGATPVNPDVIISLDSHTPNSDVVLMSQQFGGQFPLSVMANATNAALGMPANPIPEPASIWLITVGVFLIMCRRRAA